MRVLIDDHANYTATKQLRAALGADRSSDSFVVQCRYACASDTLSRRQDGTVVRPYQHAKALAISRTGDVRWYLSIPSGNLSKDSAAHQANDMVVMHDQRAFEWLLQRFEVAIRDQGTAYDRLQIDDTVLTFYPLPHDAGTEPAADPYVRLFDDVTCTVGGRHTELLLAMSLWSDVRDYLGVRMTELADQGCVVRIIGQRDLVNWGPRVTDQLVHSSAQVRRIADGPVELHTKYVVIDGFDAARRPLHTVWAGSTNFLGQALWSSDELGWSSTSPALVAAYRSHFDGVLTKHSVPVNDQR